MRIAVSSVTYEGIRRNKNELLMKLSAEGKEIFIVSPKPEKNDGGIGMHFPVEIEAHGKNPLKDYGLYRQYLTAYKKIKPDIVLNLTIKPNVYSGLACQKLHIPYIGTINGVGDAIFHKGFLSALTLNLLKFGLRRAECVFFQNTKNQELFVSKGIVQREKAALVPGSGINISLHPYEEYPESGSPVVFTFIGRVSRDKGIQELVAASRLLKSKGEHFEVNVVGSCPDGYQELIKKADEDGSIHYLGRVEPGEIHGILAKSHAVLLPSYHEGIANVLLEGGAAGRPIIASFTEGCEETFDDGVSGIGFIPQSTDSLVKAMERFLSMSNSERKSMGVKARKKIAAEFNRDMVDDAYMNAISKVGGKRK